MMGSTQTPSFGFRDLIGLICVLVFAVALIIVAFLTHAGPFILIALLVLLIFGLLRFYRERGREVEAKEVAKSIRTRLYKGEKLLATTVGDRRRIKPLASLMDFALLMFTQGLAADSSGAVAGDDTFIGLTDQRLIAIDRKKTQPGKGEGWRARLNLQRQDASKGKHAVVFEAPCEGLGLSVRLAVFYLARLNIRAIDGRTFSVGLNCRYWAERAVAMKAVWRSSEIETIP